MASSIQEDKPSQEKETFALAYVYIVPVLVK